MAHSARRASHSASGVPLTRTPRSDSASRTTPHSRCSGAAHSSTCTTTAEGRRTTSHTLQSKVSRSRASNARDAEGAAVSAPLCRRGVTEVDNVY